MSDLLAPYEPGRDGPFGLEEAAHLLRRAAFGAPLVQVREWQALGPGECIRRLFLDEEGEEASALDRTADALSELNQLRMIQALWLMRMKVSKCPALEKLALFWHNHFATSHVKVQSAELLWRQYRLLRSKGQGSFEVLLQEISRDPAMLIWLDSNSNRSTHPNENYARELMELFSLGVGSYSERDVQEAARAFTGWHERGGEFRFNERVHDFGEKQIFGRQGDFDGDDVVRMCVGHPACARFLAKKLLQFYVEPDPGSDLVEDLAQCLRDLGFDLSMVLKCLLQSKAFFSERARRSIVKSPVDLCIGAVQTLELSADFKALADRTRELGQSLFAPPSVKGWDGQRRWISSHSLLLRQRFAAAVSWESEGLSSLPWKRWSAADSQDSRARVAELILEVQQGGLKEDCRSRLTEFTEQNQGMGEEAVLRSLTQLLLALPEYQLC